MHRLVYSFILVPALACFLLALVWLLLPASTLQAHYATDLNNAPYGPVQSAANNSVVDIAATTSSPKMAQGDDPFATHEFEISLVAQPLTPAVGLVEAVTGTVLSTDPDDSEEGEVVAFKVEGNNPKETFTQTVIGDSATFVYTGTVNESRADTITAWVETVFLNGLLDAGEPTDIVTITWQKIEICMTGFAVGEEDDAIRHIMATVFTLPTESRVLCSPSEQSQLSYHGVKGLSVLLDVTTEDTNLQLNGPPTDSKGQAFFTYHSEDTLQRSDEPLRAGETILGESVNHPATPAATDIIHGWVDLNRNGKFDAGEPDDFEAVPTVITLASFTARRNNDGSVTLLWRTAAETDNAGFNLYRAPTPNGPLTKINQQLIAAQGNGSGATYTYTDESPGGARYYKLEDVDNFAISTFHGPILAGEQDQIYLPDVRP